MEVINLLVSEHGASIEATTLDNQSALHYSSKYGQVGKGAPKLCCCQKWACSAGRQPKTTIAWRQSERQRRARPNANPPVGGGERRMMSFEIARLGSVERLSRRRQVVPQDEAQQSGCAHRRRRQRFHVRSHRRDERLAGGRCGLQARARRCEAKSRAPRSVSSTAGLATFKMRDDACKHASFQVVKELMMIDKNMVIHAKTKVKMRTCERPHIRLFSDARGDHFAHGGCRRSRESRQASGRERRKFDMQIVKILLENGANPEDENAVGRARVADSLQSKNSLSPDLCVRRASIFSTACRR